MDAKALFFLSEGPKNWAENAAVRERIKTELIPLLSTVRSRRRPLNDMWASLFRVWTLEHEAPAYSGRSNIYIPAGKKAIDTQVSQLVAATFPSEDTFSVQAAASEYGEQEADVTALLKTRLEKARIRAEAEKQYRQLVITGNMAGKVRWEKKTIKRVTRKKDKAKSESPVFTSEVEDKVLFAGPVFDTVDVNNLYGWPETSKSLDDCLVVFEDIESSRRALLLSAAEKGYYVEELKAAAGNAVNPEKEQNENQRLSAQGMTSPSGEQQKFIDRLDLTEVYLNWDPKAATWDAETMPVPFLITVTASGHVIRAMENPYAFKMHPYLHSATGPVGGRLWGTGSTEGVKELQILLNDQVNQSMDCATWAMNPMAITNPNLIGGQLPDMEPGLAIDALDVNNAIKWLHPPVELIQAGGVLIQQTSSWLSDYSGAPPVLSGGSAPGRAFRSATGVGVANQNAKVPLSETVRSCEETTWQRLLQRFWELDQQFGDEEVLAKLGDGKWKSVNPQELWGDFMFNWHASTQTANAQMKASQLVQGIGLITQPAVQQALAASGMRADPAPLIKKFYTEALGFRDVDKVLLKALPPNQLGPGAGGPPGGQPNPALPSDVTDELHAAQEQLNDSPEFGETRTEANDIAKHMGANNGESAE